MHDPRGSARAGRRAVSPTALRDDCRGRRRITRHHDGADAQVCNSLMSAGKSARGGSLSAMRPASFIARRRPDGDRQHAKALVLRVPCRGRGVRGCAAASALTTAKAPFTIRCPGFRPHPSRSPPTFSSAGSNGDKLDQTSGASETALASGCRADGAIDRVLPAVRAGQRRKCQNVRLVEPGMG